MRKIDRDSIVGKEFNTNKCGKCVVINYGGYNQVTVAFKSPVYIKRCSLGALRSGGVFNPMLPTFFNKGYLGVGKYSCKDRKYLRLWQGILDRCYNEKSIQALTTYAGVEVCEDWLCFQNFAAWYDKQEFSNAKDSNGRSYQVDKDILAKGKKVYSPENCCLVPQEINVLMVQANSIRGNNPIGVYFHKASRKFVARVRKYGDCVQLGRYDTCDEAFKVYKEAKESHVKDVAKKWRGSIDERVYKALMNWTVSALD